MPLAAGRHTLLAAGTLKQNLVKQREPGRDPQVPLLLLALSACCRL